MIVEKMAPRPPASSRNLKNKYLNKKHNNKKKINQNNINANSNEQFYKQKKLESSAAARTPQASPQALKSVGESQWCNIGA